MKTCKDFQIELCMYCELRNSYFCYLRHLLYKIDHTKDIKNFICFSLEHPYVRTASLRGADFHYIKHLRFALFLKKPEYVDVFDKLSVLI